MHERPAPTPTRRRPRQSRAVDTVHAIFEAAAEIIDREGLAALNTNYLAERAGIAVGTLYGYFPNKQAILLAMARRDLEATQRAVSTAIARAPAGEIVRAAIRALIRGFGGRSRVRRVLLQTVVAEGRYDELARPVEDVARAVLGRAATIPAGGLTQGQVFVLTRAIVGVIRAAAFENSQLMGSPELEDELVLLARAYVRAASDAKQ